VTDKKPIQPGPIGVAVAQNVETLRELRNLSYAKLSRLLTGLGRPIAPLGLTRIRDLQRRVDVDDLVALALALDVSPVTLLLPDAAAVGTSGSAPVTEGGDDYPRQQIWSWLIAEAPIDVPTSIHPPSKSVLRFRLRAVPDGVGPPNFLKSIRVEHLPKALRTFLEHDASRRRLGDDDDGDD
jgi:hypothetical protein